MKFPMSILVGVFLGLLRGLQLETAMGSLSRLNQCNALYDVPKLLFRHYSEIAGIHFYSTCRWLMVLLAVIWG